MIHEYPNPELFLKRDFDNGNLQTLSSEQKQSLQENINRLQALIPLLANPDNGQQQRLLYKLSKLQQELHKKKSDMDRFWSFIGEASQTMQVATDETESFAVTLNQIISTIRQAQS